MASESTEERTVSVDLPTDLADWLDEQASEQAIDRETLLVQLLAAYRETSEFDGQFREFAEDTDELVDSLDDELEDVVTNVLVDVLDERVADSVQEQFADRIESEVEAVVTAQVNEATNAVQKQLENRIDTVESEFQEKIEDVRSRVIQVKKEADSKAPSDHTHEELAEIAAMEETIASLEADLESLESEIETAVPDHGDRLDTHTEQLDQMQDRLQTIAWVVSDLREAHQSGGLEAVERIKRAAAQADIERADCENCGNGVNLSLLTDPNCPHCDATVNNVEPSSGWFSSPRLLVASQLESGETDE